jgi:hypothetical protein
VNTFHSSDRATAERNASHLNVKFEWLENGDVKTVSPVLPAIKTLDKVDNKKVWFNSVIAAYTGSNDIRNDSPRNITYGDGKYLDPEHVKGTVELMHKNSVAIPWQNGDVMWVDNNQVLHSRKPFFTPPRKIMAYLGATCPYQ